MREQLFELVAKAGEAIMEIYDQGAVPDLVEYKEDNSPLTKADKASNDIIVNMLPEIKEIPILSEESKMVGHEERKDWEEFWLVDPLDGTKEFIRRNGEFTVNVALIKKGKPILGIIGAPEKGVVYYGELDSGAHKFEQDEWREISVSNFQKFENLKAMGSRSHASPEEQATMERFGVVEKVSMGSSFKFCKVAEGEVDLYYRHGPTMEWDTGAGQAIVEAAGGSVFKGAEPGEVFSYNKENLLNGSFICFGKRL